MQYSNKFNLPQPLVTAMSAFDDEYDAGDADISVTQLESPIQQTILIQKHGDDIIQDVSDKIWMLLGSTIHQILEKANCTGIAEKRLNVSIDGVKISGKFDRMALLSKDGGIIGKLQDYKLMSVWESIYGLKLDKIWQINNYAYICNVNNYRVAEAEIIGIFRDWQKAKAKVDKEYPQEQVKIFPVDLLPLSEQLEHIKKRVALYQKAWAGDVPGCTDDERWYSGDKWAVMKKGRKSALRVLDTEVQAREWCVENNLVINGDVYIDQRIGENRRCEDYCIVKEVCPQYKIIKEDNVR